MIERPLNEEKMKRAIRACSDMILAANPWDRVMPFPQLNGSMKIVSASGSFTFFVLADGEILQVMTAEDLTQEDDGEQDWGKHWKQERAMQEGMAHGVDAYNDAMGYDLSSPEPCGHHCVGTGCHCLNDNWTE